MRTRHSQILRLCLLLAVAASATFASVAPAGATVEKAIWGPDRFPAGHPECAGGPSCSAFPTYRQLGVEVFQFQLVWDRIAPTRPANPRNPADPAYQWPAYADFDVLQAAANGIQLAIMVKSTPAWANGGQSNVWAPTNPKDYADFMYAASQRYPSVRRWLIWGEPNLGQNFQPMPPRSPVGPRKYAQVLDAAYVALKQVSRANIVVGGMTVNSTDVVDPPAFIKWMRIGKGKKARPPRMDWYGHNPFDTRFPNLRDGTFQQYRGFNDSDTLYKELKKAYKPRKKKRKKGKGASASKSEPTSLAQTSKKKKKKKKKLRVPKLFLSEWTVLSDRSTPFFSGFFVSREQQAAYISAAYQISDATPYIVGLGWFRLDDSNLATWGLITDTGERKPAFYAYAAVP